MKILSSDQIRQWDAFTIAHQPVAAIDLMERAAGSCLSWLETNGYLTRSFTVYCGKGNNGGDGLALARMLDEKHCNVTLYLLEYGRPGTDDFQTNLYRLHQTGVEVLYIQSAEQFRPVNAGSVIIDALFGTGLNRPPDALTGRLIDHINRSGNEVIAIDIPSGMFADGGSPAGMMIVAAHTLSFQCYKMAFLLPANALFFGKVHILDIGLLPGFLSSITTDMELLEANIIKEIYRPRQSFAHKGSYGHALTIAGSYGKMGAAVLAAKACLRTGVGLHSCMIPACGYIIMQVSLPEAMVITGKHDKYITSIDASLEKYQAIGIGPGLGTEAATADAVARVFDQYHKPMVIDADALNIIAANENMLQALTPFSILTPHPKEFDRLFGVAADDFSRLQMARKKAAELKLIIVLKGHHTFIAMPGGYGYFNTTGNPGMATGGSGDVLTGILTSLLAQGYTPEETALLGVYLHGLSGDAAAAGTSQESLIASDIIDGLHTAFQKITSVEPSVPKMQQA